LKLNTTARWDIAVTPLKMIDGGADASVPLTGFNSQNLGGCPR
jgi:hypothetical protein